MILKVQLVEMVFCPFVLFLGNNLGRCIYKFVVDETLIVVELLPEEGLRICPHYFLSAAIESHHSHLQLAETKSEVNLCIDISTFESTFRGFPSITTSMAQMVRTFLMGVCESA